MFWGLSMESQKRYSQTVADSFHISQAAIDINTVPQESSPTQVILDFENNQYLLATLSKNAKIYQVPLDLNFQKGDKISFKSVGPATVHLSGYHVLEDDEDLAVRLGMGDADSDDDEEELDELTENSISDDSMTIPGKRKKAIIAASNKRSKLDDSSDEDEDGIGSTLGDSTLLELEAAEASDDEDDDEDDDDDDDDDDLEEEEEDELDDDEIDSEDEEEVAPAKTNKNGKVFAVNGTGTPSKNKAKETVKTPKSENKTSPKQGKTPNQEVKTPKQDGKTPKQEGKTPKLEIKTPKQDGKTPKQEKKTPNANSVSKSPQKKVLEGGVIAEDIKSGDGAVAKTGKTVQVYYVGRLKSNNKQFDATTGGPGFKFRLGRSEVIRGWDIGVVGMRVGGKRRLTIPAALAYGAKGSPPVIPGNAALSFEIELRNVS